MAPKALTDCPENLREAIDWLVQVQHCGGVSTVSDALVTLFDNVAQDAEKSLPSLPDPDRPSARDVVSKLRAFQSTLPKDSENPNKSVIHNLCSSAGSLLGHRSPGTYDGSGIVYGNVSRLCDAILEFLYAVFSDVHRNQPYVAGRDVLRDDVIVELKSQLWRGYKGFCQAIPKVANGLQRYNAAVKASNDNVKKPIETALEYVSTDGKLCQGIKALQISETSTPAEDEQTVESAVSLVEGCKQVARVFSKSLTAAKEAIDDLNPKLKRKLDNARRSFFNHVEWLSRWSNKGEKKRLDKMIQKINSRLKRLANAVKDKIKREVHTVVDLLKKRVREIKMKLDGITDSLGDYVKELGQWMGEAKKYIKRVREYVNKIMEQTDGENRQAIDRAAAEIDSELGKKVGELNQWIEKAEAAVKAAKEKAEDVYGRLDTADPTNDIYSGINQITAAKDAIVKIDNGLKAVNTDLQKWREAAETVLTTAVGKAEEVHKQLDPTKKDPKHPIGQKLNEIGDANRDIQNANDTLKYQVNRLHTWINEAENIRHKAETKAKEAYDKLDVHEALSQNVQKIVDAKKEIDKVNKNVAVQLGSLNQWKDQAEKVLEGAIKNAQDVHDRLQNEVAPKIEEIERDNKEIVTASTKLATEVQNLDKWNKSARDVIKKAEDKCDEILEKLKTDSKSRNDTIFSQATLLKDSGTKLLQAAQNAKQAVEEKVKLALEAVKEVDSELKRDLFDVKKKIKDGIKDVIKKLQVDDLGAKVREDLIKLRERIMKLAENGKLNGIVSGQLEELTKQKESLNQKTQEIKDDKLKEMDTNFKTAIQQPLNSEVEKVTTAIKALYDKINPNDRKASEDDKQKLQPILEHIKEQVGKIKGTKGKEENTLEGILQHVKRLAKSFVDSDGNGVYARVDGWLESILGMNQTKDKPMLAVTSWIKVHGSKVGGGEDVLKDPVKKQIMEKLRTQITLAQANIKQQHVSSVIVHNLTRVQKACEAFADELDKQLTNDKIDDFVDSVVKKIPGSSGGRGLPGENAEPLKTAAVRAALIALCSCVRQVAREVQFLGIDMFGKKIDTIKQHVDTLHSTLGEATSTSSSATGTAQAVDEAIKGVKDMVETTIKEKFDSDVKKPVVDAVKEIESEVDKFDTKAREQVKNAAETAIDKAAEEISQKNGGGDINLSNKMPTFYKAHDTIKSGLPKDLQALLDKHIGQDVTGSQANGEGDTKVELSDAFKEYSGHVNYGAVRNDFNGKLPNSISHIQTGVDEALKIIEPCVNPTNIEKIQETTFTGPFGSIESELNEIVILVNGETTYDIFESRRKGVKTLLDKIKYGLEKGKLVGTKKGLDEIRKAIEQLQTTTFTKQPEKIEEAVQAIKAQVEELKKKLQSGKGDDVLMTLKDLKETGLGINNDWQPNGKDPKISGIGKITKDIEEQNKQLPRLTEDIEEAFNQIKRELMGVLGQVGMRLDNIFVRGDVMDNLKDLKLKIGRGENIGLERIQKFIKKLQEGQFTLKPEAIGKAKDAITEELKKLQGNLQNEVSSKLTDLVEKGFGGGEQWNGHDAKGFDHIKDNLRSQQSELSIQPEQIDSGMTNITDELKSLRTELQGTGDGNPRDRGVIKNLEHLITQLGEGEDEGLKKIKSEIDSVKNNTVPLITKHLNTMSTEITNAAGQLGWNLRQLEDAHINDKLKGIQDGLDNLRLTDLAAAIKMCDDFLHKADEIEKNTVRALWKHVDHEVDDVIKDLTKEAREHYVDSVREALELFAKKVNEDLEQLPSEINRDRYMGYKGLMKYLQGPLGSDLKGDEHSVAALAYAFQEVFGQIEKYVKGEITRLHDEQNKEKNPLLPPTEEPYTSKLNDVYEALTELLVYLRDNDGAADKLTELVERLTKALSNLVPSDFKHPSTPLLDTVSIGLTKFAGEFGNCYISAYSGQRCREEHAHKYAKVLLSMVPMMYKALTKLAKKCEGEWKHLHITEFTADARDNALGNYLTKCGYRVSSSEGEQDGELNYMFTGAGIHELLTTRIEDVAIEMHLGGKPLENGINFVTITSLLYNTLCHYLQACHIPVPPNPRYPCTVRDMLSWLSGLQYTQVADKLLEHCKALLKRRCHDGDIPNRDDPIMTKCIDELPYTIATTCSRSTALLTAIQGNGHGFDLAAYPYSVDFSNNRARLHYPDDPTELLDMLRDIVCRLCRVLYFLYSQCCRSTARVKGWRECAYGRQVQSHHWQCQQIGTYSSTISTTAAPITSSTTSTHSCPPTSPLQSFLSDSCHGLLPHTLTAANMVIECANCLANQPGQQCLTPLGFWDLRFAASISGTGWDLAKCLGDMCRDADSCLFVLCRTLSLLCPAAPSSLADVFALYAQVLRQWDGHDRVNNRGGTYTDASDFTSHLNTDGIDSLFPLWKELHGSYENHKLTRAIASLAGHEHESHDALSTLFNDSTCKSPSGCAPYLQPLGLHARHTYPRKHAGLYITWIMYLAWQFWELLYQLLHALDNIDCTASGCATCPCQLGTHGAKDTCHCPSLVQCAGPLPTLYRYGFTFRNANLLVAANRTMRCSDLNTQLKEALHSAHFTELFRQIDKLIWHIRMPFLYFLIALWSLVALYILHTFLYRLDIFHIRSHLLTTKASHLIDVKALLIPSRKMLSLYDASYFDDDPSELLDAT